MIGGTASADANIEFLGLHFADIDLPGAIAWVHDAMSASHFRYVVTPNVDHVVKLCSAQAKPWHAAFSAAELAADLTLNDSRILAWLADLSGIRLPVVPGSDLTRVLLDGEPLPGARVALIGGSEAEAAWLHARLPGASVAHLVPPMGVLRDHAIQQAIVDFVERERPALTLFAIGAPQSEIVACQLQRRGVAGGVGLCIGASMEFLTGNKRRAPRFLQRLNLEWAFRLASEPRRLWRRYLVEGPRIFAIWVRWRRENAGRPQR